MNDMGSQTASEILAANLGTDRETAQHRLDAFSGVIIAELLEKGRLAVDGLGTFSVAHDGPSREMTPEGMRVLPPRNRLVFDARSPGLAESLGIVTKRMGIEAEAAKSLVLALARTFNHCRQQGVDLKLRGIGVFLTQRDGTWLFSPDAAIGELLNTAYHGLEAIAMPDGGGMTAGGVSNKLKSAALVLGVLLVCLGGYLVFRATQSGDANQVSLPEITAPASSDAAKTLLYSPGSSFASSAQTDSLVLGKGRFTVIAATYSSSKVAKSEAHRLSGLGLRIMIWPVRDGGRRYFRLVTGDFGTYRSAYDSLRVMPGGLVKTAYIQQAYKNVVIYGEHGL